MRLNIYIFEDVWEYLFYNWMKYKVATKKNIFNGI